MTENDAGLLAVTENYKATQIYPTEKIDNLGKYLYGIFSSEESSLRKSNFEKRVRLMLTKKPKRELI